MYLHRYGFYCKNDNQLWNKVPKNPNYPSKYNPNAEFGDDPEAAMYWLQFSDFYDWPHIQFFDDVNDLVSKLTTTDFQALSMAMARENVIRETVLLEQWCHIIRNIPESNISMVSAWGGARW